MNTYKIQANKSGSRYIVITELHLQTIERYHLLSDLIDSNGYVDELVLQKLQLNVRSLLESTETSKDKDLLDLCLDVIYHPNMKAFGLQHLLTQYISWKESLSEQKPQPCANEQSVTL